MAANTKQLKYDVDKKPSPQYFDPELDEYGYLLGANGAARHILYGADGQPITTDGNKLAVRATEIETQLTAIQGYIDGIEGTLATLATASNQAAIAGYIDQVEAQLTAIQGYVDGLEGAIGQAVADPAVNTLLARVKNLETKLTAIIAGTSPAVVQLSGSNLVDTQAIPIKPVSKIVTLANAVAITTAGFVDFELKRAGISYDELRRYRRFRFTFYNTHDQPADITIQSAVPARGEDFHAPVSVLYTESNVLTATTGYLIIQGTGGGTGMEDTTIKVVPCLNDALFGSLRVGVNFNTAPTSGALSIACEMGV